MISRVRNWIFGNSESEYPVSYDTIDCSSVSVRIATIDDHEHEWSSVPREHIEVEGMPHRNPLSVHECSYTECPAELYKERTGEKVQILND